MTQAQAVASQYLPPISCYTGEGSDATEDSFDRWLECYEERIAGRTKEQQLYQLKTHLDKTAGEVFCMLPETDPKDLKRAVAALRKCFKPADIEELRGLQFHHKIQGNGETIEQLGRKASITGKDSGITAERPILPCPTREVAEETWLP